MARFRKRPIEVEAFRYDGSEESQREIVRWAEGKVEGYFDGEYYLQVNTLHGPTAAAAGDWVVKGPQGDFWPVQPEIFEDSYEDPDLHVARQMVGEPSCGDPDCPCQRRPSGRIVHRDPEDDSGFLTSLGGARLLIPGERTEQDITPPDDAFGV